MLANVTISIISIIIVVESMYNRNMDYYYVGDQRWKKSRRLTQSLRIVRVYRDERDLFEERRVLWAEEKKHKGRQAGKNNMAAETRDIALTTRVMFVEMQ